MTTRKHLKRRVRLRAAQTGEPYVTALRSIRQQQETRMPSTAPTHPEAVVSCSFCGQPDTAVDRLVAGPGVFICNVCVELSAAVIEEASRSTPEEAAQRRSRYGNLSTDEILTMLPVLLRSADRVERELAGWVTRLREQGTDWQVIADATGLDSDAARRRFGTTP